MKKVFKILLLLLGLFFMLIAFASLGSAKELGFLGVIGMFIGFGFLSFVCLFFSRGLFINSISNYEKLNKEYKELLNKVEEKQKQIETLDNRLHELSGEVGGLYKTKEKLEKEKDKYLKTIGEYRKDFSKESIELVDKMDGVEFETFIASLLKKHGYKKINVTPASNDYGIDVIAELNGVKYAFQCKNYSSDVGSKAVQEVYSGKQYYDCHVGIVVTNRFFTRQARELANKNDILLWDRNKLISLIEKI